MTLHHIRQLGPLLRQFYSAVLPGGRLCIADLDPEEGRFHGDNRGVFHSGFDRAALRQDLTKAGFTAIRDRTAATVMKPDAAGVKQPFTVMLMTGRRKP